MSAPFLRLGAPAGRTPQTDPSPPTPSQRSAKRSCQPWERRIVQAVPSSSPANIAVSKMSIPQYTRAPLRRKTTEGHCRPTASQFGLVRHTKVHLKGGSPRRITLRAGVPVGCVWSSKRNSDSDRLSPWCARTIGAQAATHEYSSSCRKCGTLSQLLGMVHHLPRGLRIGQQLARPGIDHQRPHAAKHAFPRQGEHDGNRPVNALPHGRSGAPRPAAY